MMMKNAITVGWMVFLILVVNQVVCAGDIGHRPAVSYKNCKMVIGKNDVAYIGINRALYRVDLTSASPVIKRSDLAETITCLGLDSSNLYVSVSESILVYSLKQNSPIPDQKIKLDGMVIGFVIQADGAYCLVGKKGRSLEIVDLNAAKVIGKCVVVKGADTICINGNKGYVSSYSSGVVESLNLSDRKKPFVRQHLKIEYDFTPYHPCDIALNGENLYVMRDGRAGIMILHDSDLNGMQIISDFGMDDILYGIWSANHYLFIAGSVYGLYIMNVADPLNPNDVGRYDTQPNECEALFATDRRAYILYSCENEVHELQVIDISNPSSPHLLTSCDIQN